MPKMPTQRMKRAARQGLKWHEEGFKGGEKAGVPRARQILSGKAIPDADIIEMSAWFARHAKSKSPNEKRDRDNPSPWYKSWQLWGGDDGQRWSTKHAARIKKQRKQKKRRKAQADMNTAAVQTWADRLEAHALIQTPESGVQWWQTGSTWAIEAKHAPIAPCPYKVPQAMLEAGQRDRSTAYIHIGGVLSPRRSWFGSSYERLKMDLNAAAQDPMVRRVVLVIDSPGGDAAGVSGVAEMVAKCADSKTVVAYVDGMCCSAAYWIASQADYIVATPTSLVGSIGALLTAYSMDRYLQKEGIDKVTLRSEGAPDKARNPATDKRGAELDQKMLNDLEAQFHAAVAEGRGVSIEKVKSDFGQGGVFVAGEGTAVAVDMIDEVGSLSDALAYTESQEAPAYGGYRLDNDNPAPSAGDGGDMASKSQTAPAPEAVNPLAEKVETLTAQLDEANAKVEALAAEKAQAEANAKEAQELAASHSERLTAIEAQLEEHKASAEAEKSQRLAIEKQTALDALDNSGFLVAGDRERAEAFWDLQHVSGVPGAWDNYKATIEARGPVVPQNRLSHGVAPEKKTPAQALDEKVKAYMEAHSVDYVAALDAIQAGKA